MAEHPRDRFITVYGRKPVLEALGDERVTVDKLLVAQNASGEVIAQIAAVARRRGVKLKRVSLKSVTRISKNGRQDQGVVMDVIAPRMQSLASWLETEPERANLLMLDGVTTPGNVGMILRAATGAGLDGVVLARAGSPEVGPLVIKASAGVALRAPILRAATAVEAASLLRRAGFTLYGLRMEGAEDLYTADLTDKGVFVLGNETHGVSEAVAKHVNAWIRIPMHNEVESLNVATAGAVVAFEVARRKTGPNS